MSNTVPLKWRDNSVGRKAWAHGYNHGLAQCDHHPEAETVGAVNAIVATHNHALVAETRKAGKRGYDIGYERGVRFGVAKVRKEANDQANTWLMEAFILFMQEHGSDMAAMTLGQMHELRKQVNDVDRVLGAIEEPR